MQKAGISDDALALLQEYDFPGNVRELENILQRALALAEDNVIKAHDLPSLKNRSEEAPVDPVQETRDQIALEDDFSLEKHLEKIEKAAIEKALEETRWNKTAAAKKLGMTFRSFRYRLKKLGVD